MRWIPPTWSDRRLWIEAHPWIAGCWGGLGFACVMGLGLAGTGHGIRLLVACAISGLVAALFFGLALRTSAGRHWGERPDAELHPASVRRPWSRASARWLGTVTVVAPVGAIVVAADLISGPNSPVLAVVVLVTLVYATITAVMERMRRRSGERT